MICPNCGKELVKMDITLTPEEIRNMQFAISKQNVGNSAKSPEVIESYGFTSSEEKQAYIKACLDEVSEGVYLYNTWETALRTKYNFWEPCELSVINGELYKHI